MTPTERGALRARLEALVYARDPDLIRQGCELLVSLQDATLLRQLGEGCEITADGRLLLGNPLFGRILPDFRSIIALQLALSVAELRGQRPTQLRLPYDRIGDDGAALIASAGALSELVQLDLRGCHIRNAGAASLATAASLPRLRVLDLSDNHIERDGALALSHAGLALEQLDVRRNRFGRDGWRALEAAWGARLVTDRT